MAKLYAELTSDKRGRIASKGGNKWIQAQIRNGNKVVIHVEYMPESNQLSLSWTDETLKVSHNGARIQ